MSSKSAVSSCLVTGNDCCEMSNRGWKEWNEHRMFMEEDAFATSDHPVTQRNAP